MFISGKFGNYSNILHRFERIITILHQLDSSLSVIELLSVQQDFSDIVIVFKCVVFYVLR